MMVFLSYRDFISAKYFIHLSSCIGLKLCTEMTLKLILYNTLFF